MDIDVLDRLVIGRDSYVSFETAESVSIEPLANPEGVPTMPRMTTRWRNAAIILAILGFAAVAIQGNVLGAIINGAIWFGMVYVAFLVSRAIRAAPGRSRLDRHSADK